MKLFKERIFTPKYKVFDSLPSKVEYGHATKYPEYLSVPMKSGRRALYHYDGIETPWNPGDQHFHRFRFIKYLRSAPQTTAREGESK